ncbi:hypothetical protein HDV00_011591 [Rhizophlyctis rosea]|nr:hypothetical protein HDV00_011591 [Rhizophlyctis rosea]
MRTILNGGECDWERKNGVAGGGAGASAGGFGGGGAGAGLGGGSGFGSTGSGGGSAGVDSGGSGVSSSGGVSRTNLEGEKDNHGGRAVQDLSGTTSAPEGEWEGTDAANFSAALAYLCSPRLASERGMAHVEVGCRELFTSELANPNDRFAAPYWSRKSLSIICLSTNS